MLSRVAAFVRLGRPLFLTGGIVLHALGAAIAVYAGASFDLGAYVWGQVAITSIQWMTHYCNDYFDYTTDLANRTPTQWSGGSRVLPSGALPPRVALTAAVVLAMVASGASLALALVIRTGALTLPLLALALGWAWSYSAPPLRLEMRGLGELTVALLVPGLTPLVGFYLQAGRLDWLPLIAALPLCCLQFAMSLSINFPDAAGDRATGKRTLLVRIGARRAARLYQALVATAYAALFPLSAIGLPLLAAVAVSAPAPLAIWLCWRMARGEWQASDQWNSLAFWSIGLFVGTMMLETAAFILLALEL